jgi:hypothetical protein
MPTDTFHPQVARLYSQRAALRARLQSTPAHSRQGALVQGEFAVGLLLPH